MEESAQVTGHNVEHPISDSLTRAQPYCDRILMGPELVFALTRFDLRTSHLLVAVFLEGTP